MKIFKSLVIVTIAFCININSLYSQQTSSYESHEKDSVIVTYIANSGYLIEFEDFKIVIDGIFVKGRVGIFEHPDSVMIEQMSENFPPFNGIDYIFVSHKHPDHFDAPLVAQHLISNSKCKVICPKQVENELKEDENYKKIKSRIIEITPDTCSYAENRFNDFDLISCRLWHGTGKNKKIVDNIGNLIKYKGFNILHSGDAWFANFNDPLVLDYSKQDIDIAILGFDCADTLNVVKTKEIFDAKNYIFMHLPLKHVDEYFNPLKENPELINNPFFFSKKMERKVYYFSKNNLFG